MPKRVRLDTLPKTPGGINIQNDVISPGDVVEIDDEITVKGSMLRLCVPGNPWFEGEEDEDDVKPKYVIRKSTDLRKIRSIRDRVAAIVSSPMVDARPRRSSKSFTEGVAEGDDTWTPIKVSNKHDLMHSTSRRLSRMILSRRNSTLACAIQEKPHLFLHDGESTPISSSVATAASPYVAPAQSSNKENDPPLSILPARLQSQPDLDTNVGRPDEPLTVNSLRLLAEVETARLKVVCGDWNGVLSEESNKLPQQAVDSIRTTICKCQLVLQHKLPFFLSLCDMAERSDSASTSDSGAAPKADVNDLAGYWDLVADEIHRADEAFDRLRKWRDEWYWDESRCPITPPRSALPVLKRVPGKANTTVLPKRIASDKASRIPTKRTPGRKVAVECLPKNTSDAIALTVSRSAQKRTKAIPTSKFSEFLKAKKAAMSSASSKASSPKVDFVTGPPGEEVPPSAAPSILATPQNAVGLSHRTPSTSNTSMLLGDSFAVPKCAPAPRSSVQRSTRSVRIKSTAEIASDIKASPLRARRIASTPLAVSTCPPTSPPPSTGESTRRLPRRSSSSLAGNSPRQQNISVSRPGTPRPAVKPKSTPRLPGHRSILTPVFSPSESSTTENKPLTGRRRSVRTKKRISFATELSRTPGGHPFGSGSPRDAYPITPANKAGSLVAVDRVQRRRTNLLETLTPLGLRPVTPRSATRLTKN